MEGCRGGGVGWRGGCDGRMKGWIWWRGLMKG